jgi:hypothetical protein
VQVKTGDSLSGREPETAPKVLVRAALDSSVSGQASGASAQPTAKAAAAGDVFRQLLGHSLKQADGANRESEHSQGRGAAAGDVVSASDAKGRGTPPGNVESASEAAHASDKTRLSTIRGQEAGDDADSSGYDSHDGTGGSYHEAVRSFIRFMLDCDLLTF